MTLIRYNSPFSLAPFQAPASRSFLPQVDVFETESAITLKADLPGVRIGDLNIKVENDTLVLSGERAAESTEQNSWQRLERSYGSFTRQFSLPDTVDSQKVAASLKDGVLTITLAKKDAAKPRTIQVEIQ
jgi:HSP20 family protein